MAENRMHLGSHQIGPGLHNLRPSDKKETNFSIVNISIILFGVATESIFYLKTNKQANRKPRMIKNFSKIYISSPLRKGLPLNCSSPV